MMLKRLIKGVTGTSLQFVNHMSVKAATLCHWLKAIMKPAGIDTNTFSAHSTRGVLTSKAKLIEVSTSDILKLELYPCFYHRQHNSDLFGYGVLREQAFKHR